MEKNNNLTIKILIGVIIGLSSFLLLVGIFCGVFYIFSMQNKIAKLETQQEEQQRKEAEAQNMTSVQAVQPVQPQTIVKTRPQPQVRQPSQTRPSSSSNGINITKEEGAYIRANFNTFFGRSEVCHNIGRNHVNFPAIYNGNRPDLSAALLKFIKKADSSFIDDPNISSEDNVMSWYALNCVKYNAVGAQNSKILKRFYEYASSF